MATITNSINANNLAVTIQSNGGAIALASLANVTVLNIGNTSGKTTFNAGTGLTNFNSGIDTSPPSSNTAGSIGFTTFGTAFQNTLGYNVLFTCNTKITTGGSGNTFTAGVGPTSTPTTNTIIPSPGSSNTLSITISFIVPNNYYGIINVTGSGSSTSNTNVIVTPL